MGAKALFSRSHLNISFRSIDLFCVTYPGPFFVIKKRGELWQGDISQSGGYPSVCWCVSVYLMNMSRYNEEVGGAVP